MENMNSDGTGSVEKLDITGKYLISVLASVLNETSVPPLPSATNWESVYNMAKMHGVEAMAFYAVKNAIDNTAEIYYKWKQSRDQNLVQSLFQFQERDEIYQRLYEYGIRFLPLKGCRMKELYKQIEFRQMSDLDILIEPQNLEKVRTVMEALGYETRVFGEKHDDEYFKPPYVTVEIHRQMLPDNVPKHTYYCHIWDKALPDEKIQGGWKLSLEDFYIYHLLHFQKHFNEMGSGIRSLMDIYVYRRAFSDQMDSAYLEQECDRLELSEFRKKMEVLSVIWFTAERKFDEAIYDSELKQLERRIFLAGVYGSRNFTKVRSMESNQVDTGIKQTCIYILKRIFMSKEEFGYAYPITKKYAVLIPFFWFYRIYDVLAHKRNDIKREIELFWSQKE